MRFLKKIFTKSRAETGGIFFTEVSNILGFAPKNIALYEAAFTHRSSNKTDTNGHVVSYERLEFLGDAMLGSVVAAHLFREVPSGDEGYLTKMRSKVVSREHLNELGKDLNLVQLVESKVSPKHFGDNIHGNIFEALVGALFLDQGYAGCERFIHSKVIKPYVDISKLEGKVISYKSLLIEWCQKEKKTFRFETFEEESVGTERFFGVRLYLNEAVVAKARATSKKKAEEKAAQRAYFALQKQIVRKA